MGLIDGAISGIANGIEGILGKFVTDPDKKLQAQTEITELIQNNAQKVIDDQRDVIVAEAQGRSWLQRNWRPILMLSFTLIIINNYILSPYLQAMFGWQVKLDLPPEMWDLLKIGIGGYIVGRSGEKIMSSFKQGGS